MQRLCLCRFEITAWFLNLHDPFYQLQDTLLPLFLALFYNLHLSPCIFLSRISNIKITEKTGRCSCGLVLPLFYGKTGEFISMQTLADKLADVHDRWVRMQCFSTLCVVHMLYDFWFHKSLFILLNSGQQTFQFCDVWYMICISWMLTCLLTSCLLIVSIGIFFFFLRIM